MKYKCRLEPQTTGRVDQAWNEIEADSKGEAAKKYCSCFTNNGSYDVEVKEAESEVFSVTVTSSYKVRKKNEGSKNC